MVGLSLQFVRILKVLMMIKRYKFDISLDYYIYAEYISDDELEHKVSSTFIGLEDEDGNPVTQDLYAFDEFESENSDGTKSFVRQYHVSGGGHTALLTINQDTSVCMAYIFAGVDLPKVYAVFDVDFL